MFEIERGIHLKDWIKKTNKVNVVLLKRVLKLINESEMFVLDKPLILMLHA